MSTALSARTSTGGISKRSGVGRARVDRDGDLDMDAPMNTRSGGRGRGPRGGAQKRGGGGGRSMNISNAPKGPAAERNRGASGSGAGRDRRRDPVGTRSRTSVGVKGISTGPLVEAKVLGWKQSKGSAEECVSFLERKTHLKFNKTQKQGDYLLIYVPANKVDSLLDWDNALFAGANLKISSDLTTSITNSVVAQAAPKGADTQSTMNILEQVLANRYNVESKLLDLSNLGDDPLLKASGFFDLGSTTSKMFPALMLVADKKFVSAAQKREYVHSVSLAGNGLKSVIPVTSLAQTFPDLKNLSLEGNAITHVRGMENWRHKFRDLEQLVCTGNPVTSTDLYRPEMIKRYPKLIMLDNVPVDRVQIQVGEKNTGSKSVTNAAPTVLDVKGKPVLPLPTKGNLLVDNDGVAMNFLSSFFALYDNNRGQVLQNFYTADSTFSLSVNTSAPRVEAQQNIRQYWDNYIPLSRNLKRLRGGPQLVDRLATGVAEIRTVWDKLPNTRHNLANQDLWSFDCFPIETSMGVICMLAMVHSEFEEENASGGGVIKRSFDRNFVLAPNGNGGVHVVSDTLTIRSYAGSEAWKVDPNAVQPQQQMAPPVQQQPQQQAPVVQQPLPAITVTDDVEEKREKCRMLSEKSGLNLQWSELCLNEAGWDLVKAWEIFAQAKTNGTLGPEAFAK